VPPAPVATATAKPQIIVPTATPGRPATYTIQQGDHYLCLARRYNLNPEEFLSLNGLSMNSQAVVGATVKLPQGGSWPSSFGARALKAHPDTYTVQAGDTLNKIACGYGDADPNAISAANTLGSPITLTAGQTLDIP
jgi:LysM repeat protein